MFTQNAVFYARIWIDVFVDKKHSILDRRDIIKLYVSMNLFHDIRERLSLKKILS